MVVEQGISTKSFVLSMVFTVLAFASMLVFLPFIKGKDLAIQILCVLVTLLLFLLGILFWSGYFDKKKPVEQKVEEELKRGLQGLHNTQTNWSSYDEKPRKKVEVSPTDEWVNKFMEGKT